MLDSLQCELTVDYDSPCAHRVLNRLVMNYLVVEGHKDIAQTFQEETGTECTGHANS